MIKMLLLICVLNKTECLEDILTEFAANGIHGATVLESRGMAHILAEASEFRIMDSIVKLLNLDNSESKTFFMVIKNEMLPEVSDIINDVTGGLDRPDTGVIFTVPVNYTEGFGKNNVAED